MLYEANVNALDLMSSLALQNTNELASQVDCYSHTLKFYIKIKVRKVFTTEVRDITEIIAAQQ